MYQRDPFVISTPDVDSGFCPICSGRIDPGTVSVDAKRDSSYVDFSCASCGDVRLDLGKPRDGRGFIERLETVLDQYDRSHPGDSTTDRRSWDIAKAQTRDAGSLFRRRMTDWLVDRRSRMPVPGRIAVSGAGQTSGSDTIQFGGLAGVTAGDLIIDGGGPHPNATATIPLE